MSADSRRSFLENISATALAAVYPSSFVRYTESLPNPSAAIIKPSSLRPGALVGLVSPASGVYEREEIRMAQEIAESLGLRVEIGRHAGDAYGFLAGQDQDRADDLSRMFQRRDVHAVWAVRGGYGSSRLLPLLDYAVIRDNPKPLIGYSDITALHLAIHRLSGLVTFHGPIARQLFSEYTLKAFKKALFQGEPIGPTGLPPPFSPREGATEWENRVVVIGGGKCEGRTTGGNLSLVTATLGTPFEIDTRGRILFLEDVGEEPYRVDRMLTQLWLSGKLSEAAGVVFGKFSNCGPAEYKPGYSNTLSLEEVLRIRMEPLKIPCLYGLLFGHVRDNATLPLGVRAALDADAKNFTILESAVVL